MSDGSREDAEASARDLLHLSETGSDRSNSPEPGTVNSSLSQKRKRSTKDGKDDDKSTVAKKHTSSVVKESKRLLTVLASLVCPDATRPKLASIMIAAIAEIRRIDPVASAAVKAFKPSKVVEDDTATRVGNAKSDGAANETVSKKPSQSSRTPYIRSWRKNNRGLESELRCLLSIRSPLVPKSKEALYTHAIERIEASRRAQPFQENDKSQKVHLAHQLSASTLQSTARIGVARHQRTQVHRGLPLMDGLPPPLHPHSGAMAHSVPISPALFYHYCICYAVQTVGMPFARAHKWATHMINPASMGSSNMPGPGHNNGVSGGLPQDMLSRVLYASSRSSEEPILSGSIPPLFFRTTDGSDATASVHTESGGELHSRGKLHAHTALPSASFQQPQLPVNPVRKGR